MIIRGLFVFRPAKQLLFESSRLLPLGHMPCRRKNLLANARCAGRDSVAARCVSVTSIMRLQVCQQACPCAILRNRAITSFNSQRLPLPNTFGGRLMRGRHRSTSHRAAADWRDAQRNWPIAATCQQSQRGHTRCSRPLA
jgi:hypothetical protein